MRNEIVTVNALEDLFDRLDAAVGLREVHGGLRVDGCDGTHRQVRTWAAEHALNGRAMEELVELLQRHGGHCDCEALFNAAERLLPADE